MKILFLSRYQNNVPRGAEVFVAELGKRLAKKHEVAVWPGADSDNLSKVLAGRHDVVVPVNGRIQSLKASTGRLVGGYKLLISGHSGIGRDDIWNIAVARPDVFVALTGHMAKWARKWAWASQVVTIPNGIDIDKFKPEGEKIALDLPRPVILSVGALVWYKHHERAVEAVSKMGKGSLVVVGQGEDRGKLEQLGKERLGDRFQILGMGFDQMPKIYRSADLFTLPSWEREAFGIVYLEAMASGLGVVAPDDESRREIVGDAGLYADVGNPQKYAQALEQALGISWGDRPRKQAEKFSWEIVAKKYEEVFEKLVGGK